MKRKVSVTGLGYVGLPVAVAFGTVGSTIGFDVNPRRIEELRQGHDRTGEVSKEDLEAADILFTDRNETLRMADFHIIAVPTPVDDAKRPDLSLLLKASEAVGKALKKGDIVVYESTVYPGATEEECVPVLEQASGLSCGKDFTVGYSPERINPGDREHTFTRIVKVVSGQDPQTLDIVASVYESVVTAGVHRAASIKVAEAAKVIENTQRDLNIALMNELALIFDRLGIDTMDVLSASGTKWNFLPFKPGLVGGHCIGVDPYYLTHKAERIGYRPAHKRRNGPFYCPANDPGDDPRWRHGPRFHGHRPRSDLQGELPRHPQLQGHRHNPGASRLRHPHPGPRSPR
jgi:UDP-N-acetyl-D-galactosamine dehydrogenase